MSRRSSRAPSFIAVALLLLYAWLELSTLAITSPTADESLHIMRGYIFVTRGDDRYRMRGPVLSNALTGLTLAALEPPIYFPPSDDPIWEHVALGDDPDRICLGRTCPRCESSGALAHHRRELVAGRADLSLGA